MFLFVVVVVVNGRRYSLLSLLLLLLGVVAVVCCCCCCCCCCCPVQVDQLLVLVYTTATAVHTTTHACRKHSAARRRASTHVCMFVYPIIPGNNYSISTSNCALSLLLRLPCWEELNPPESVCCHTRVPLLDHGLDYARTTSTTTWWWRYLLPGYMIHTYDYTNV